MSQFTGKWSMGEVPEEFFEILKFLGYNGIQRKVVRNTNPTIKTNFEDGVLTVKVSSKLFNRAKEYKVNGELLEYIDEWKNPVMEICKFRDENTIETQTTYIEKNVMVNDVREVQGDKCLHYVMVMAPELESPIEVNMTYTRI